MNSGYFVLGHWAISLVLPLIYFVERKVNCSYHSDLICPSDSPLFKSPEGLFTFLNTFFKKNITVFLCLCAPAYVWMYATCVQQSTEARMSVSDLQSPEDTATQCACRNQTQLLWSIPPAPSSVILILLPALAFLLWMRYKVASSLFLNIWIFLLSLLF